GLVGNDRVSSPRYNAWFGAYSVSRYNQVVSNFTAIDQALENERYNLIVIAQNPEFSPSSMHTYRTA
ncbi:MAG: hypothetical protein ACJAZF_003354, partial [Granulosicoccus sp.]